MRLIAVVVLDDVGTMWVHVVFLRCLSRLRDVGKCDGVGRVVIFCYCLLKKFEKLVKCFHLFVSNV